MSYYTEVNIESVKDASRTATGRLFGMKSECVPKDASKIKGFYITEDITNNTPYSKRGSTGVYTYEFPYSANYSLRVIRATTTTTLATSDFNTLVTAENLDSDFKYWDYNDSSYHNANNVTDFNSTTQSYSVVLRQQASSGTFSLTGAYVVRANVPIFDKSDTAGIDAYVKNGDDSHAKNYNELHAAGVDWGIYIGEGTKPTIKVGWKWQEHSDVVKPSEYTVAFNNGSNQVARLRGSESGTYQTSYASLLAIQDPSIFDTIVNSISEVSVNPVDLKMRFQTSEGGRSDTVYIKVGWQGGVDDYGNTKDLNGFSTIVVYTNPDDFNNAFDDTNDKTDDSDTNSPTDGGNAYTGVGDFSFCDVIDTAGLATLRAKIFDTGSGSFSESIAKALANPIEAIFSIKRFPFSFTSEDTVALEIGNYPIGINVQRLRPSTEVKKHICDIPIPREYNSFLDQAGFTTVEIHLPYIGYVSLPTNQVMNRTVGVDYIVDIINGVAQAVLTLNNTEFMRLDCHVAIDIPISASNHAEKSLAILGNLASVALNPSVLSIGSAIINSATIRDEYTTSGKMSPVPSSFGDTSVFVRFTRPVIDIPVDYYHYNGGVCRKVLKLGNLEGYTEVGQNVDLKNIHATYNEKEELKRILTTGFYM